MTTTGSVGISDAATPTKQVADYTFGLEDGVTKLLQRVATNDPTGADIFGTQGDAAATPTDTTRISWTSIFKQLSASLQALVAGGATAANQATGNANLATLAGVVSAARAAVKTGDGDQVTIGSKTDAKNAATDGTAVSAMAVWKQISASIQAAAASLSAPLTVSDAAAETSLIALAAIKADLDSIAASQATIGAKTDAKNVATDGTAISAMAVWKQISASIQAAAASLAGTVHVDVPSANPSAPQALNSSSSVALSIGSAPISIPVNPAVTASSTYTAGNVVGGLLTFTGAGRDPNNSGIVQDVTLNFKTVQTGEFDLYLFNSNPTASTWADKTAPAITDADKLAVIGVVKMTKNNSGLGVHTIYKPDETTFAPIPFSGANLYGILVTPGVPSAQFGATSDLSVILGVI